MFPRRDPDVLIAGAGPVGMVAALNLVQRGLSVEIVDEEQRTAAHSYAMALHPASVQLLAELGLHLERHGHGVQVDTVAFYEGPSRRAELDLTALPVPHPYLLVLRQSHLEMALEEALRKHKTKVLWNHRISAFQEDERAVSADVHRLDSISTGYPVAVTEREVTRTHDFRARYLVGADGHRSLTRRLLECRFEPVADPLLFAVYEFQCGTEPCREARMVLDGQTMSVMWPLPDGRCRWSFQLVGEDAELEGSRYKSRYAVQVGRDFFPHLTEDLLRRLLADRAPWFPPQIAEIYWSTVVRFERRLADRFGRGRVWLAGDAAHLTGPIGMHSMNIGFREARDLTGRIARHTAGEAGPETFEEYERERLTEWRFLLGADGGLAPTPDTDEWVARNAERILACIPASGESYELLARQIGLDITAGERRSSEVG